MKTKSKRQRSTTAQVSVVYCLYPDARSAERTAKLLLHEKKIVCANMTPAVKSLYLWQGKLEKSSEVIVLFKTRKSRVATVMKAIKEGHPYQVPFIAEVPPLKVNAEYGEYLESILPQHTAAKRK